MKTNRNPLDIIRYILDSVTLFFGGKMLPITIEDKVFDKKKGTIVPFCADSYEFAGKAVMNDMNFLKNLKEYEKD